MVPELMSLRLEHFGELFDLTAKVRVLFARDDAHAALSALSFNSENWLEQILCEMPHNIDHNPVSHKVVSFIVVLGQLIAVIETHQSRRLSCRDQSRPNLISVDNHDGLSAGAAGWCPQASGDIIKPNFRSLHLYAIFVVSRSLIDPSNHATARALGRFNFRQIDFGHHRQYLLGLSRDCASRRS